MSQQLNNQPQYNVPLINGKVTSKDWYFFWLGLFKRLAPALETVVTVGVSPFTFSSSVGGFVLITGGTVSLVEFSRDGSTFHDYGTTVGQFQINAADLLRVTYSAPPDMVFVPT